MHLILWQLKMFRRHFGNFLGGEESIEFAGSWFSERWQSGTSRRKRLPTERHHLRPINPNTHTQTHTNTHKTHTHTHTQANEHTHTDTQNKRTQTAALTKIQKRTETQFHTEDRIDIPDIAQNLFHILRLRISRYNRITPWKKKHHWGALYWLVNDSLCWVFHVKRR